MKESEKKVEGTFAVPTGRGGRWLVLTALHAVHLPGLDAAPAQGRLVGTPLVLLTEQRVHAALSPFCGSPAIPASINKNTEMLQMGRYLLNAVSSLLIFSLQNNNNNNKNLSTS